MTSAATPQDQASAPDAMKNRCARFETLTPLPIQKDASIPLVVISGGAHNIQGIHMPAAAAHAIHAASPAFMRRLADSGITYSGELV